VPLRSSPTALGTSASSFIPHCLRYEASRTLGILGAVDPVREYEEDLTAEYSDKPLASPGGNAKVLARRHLSSTGACARIDTG